MISLLAAAPLLLPSAYPPSSPQGGGAADDQAVVQGAEEIPMIQDAGTRWILTFASPDDAAQPQQGKGVTLESFVKICQEVTDKNFVYTQETAGLLRSATIKMLGSKEVPKDEFYSFFQIIIKCSIVIIHIEMKVQYIFSYQDKFINTFIYK